MDGRQRILRDRVRQHHGRMIVARRALLFSSPACGEGSRTARALCLAAAMSAAASFTFSAEIPLDQRKSGYDFMPRQTRTMQHDDTANPGMFSVLDGESLWNRKGGTAEKSCADWHGEATASMKGVAARYPAFSPARGRPVDLEQRINICRTEQQKAAPLAAESKELLALEA